jgi:hypothetical protein
MLHQYRRISAWQCYLPPQPCTACYLPPQPCTVQCTPCQPLMHQTRMQLERLDYNHCALHLVAGCDACSSRHYLFKYSVNRGLAMKEAAHPHWQPRIISCFSRGSTFVNWAAITWDEGQLGRRQTEAPHRPSLPIPTGQAPTCNSAQRNSAQSAQIPSLRFCKHSSPIHLESECPEPPCT